MISPFDELKVIVDLNLGSDEALMINGAMHVSPAGYVKLRDHHVRTLGLSPESMTRALPPDPPKPTMPVGYGDWA